MDRRRPETVLSGAYFPGAVSLPCSDLSSLINDARWQNKDAMLHESGAPLLLAPIEETLAALREEIEARFVSVNKRIEDGSNKHIEVTGVGAKRRWTLVYPADEEEPVKPVLQPTTGDQH